MDTMANVQTISDELRSIRIDDGPRYQPLQLDKMFLRAGQWQNAPSNPHDQLQPPSPPRRRTVFPLPRPLTEGHRGLSPLSGLFEYPELIPHVLKWFERPGELATLARVNHTFYGIVSKALYQNVWIRPWEQHCHEKLVLLFRSLKDSPRLCTLIKTLDMRFFPLATTGTEEGYKLEEHIQVAVAHMIHLEHLIWTRDRSLNRLLFAKITKLERIRTLEISGHSQRYYDPALISRLPVLEDLRVMIPDSTFCEALTGIVAALDERPIGGLKGLSIIAQSCPFVTDQMLKNIARHLRHLRRLTFWGCGRITREGVFEILREAENLTELSLDASHHKGLNDLSSSPSLPNLQNLSLSFPPPHRTPAHPEIITSDLPLFPPTSTGLKALLLTLSGDRAFIPPGGLEHFSSQINFAHLKRLSVLNLFIETDTLTSILDISPNLEELYISVKHRKTVLECQEWIGRGLTILHVNAPEWCGPDTEDLTHLAEVMPALEQIGTGNKVYEISRRYDGDDHVVELSRWSRTTVPGYFQVWRG